MIPLSDVAPTPGAVSPRTKADLRTVLRGDAIPLPDTDKPKHKPKPTQLNATQTTKGWGRREQYKTHVVSSAQNCADGFTPFLDPALRVVQLRLPHFRLLRLEHQLGSDIGL